MSGLRRLLPSPNALFVFEAAVRHRNFSRAAEELNVTQPAVSRAIGDLETHLGVPLFERRRDGAEPTEAGRRLGRAVMHGFAEIASVLEEITQQPGPTVVTLSVSTAFTTHWLMPRIDRFRGAFPDVDLRFQLIAGPVGGPMDGVDLGIRYETDPPAGAQVLMREAHVPVAAPGRAAGPRIRLEGAEARGNGADLAFSDYAIVLQAALAGQGVAQGWVNIAAHWLLSGLLVPCGGLTVTDRQCCLIVRPGREAAGQVADWIADEMRSDLAGLARQFPDLGLDRLRIG